MSISLKIFFGFWVIWILWYITGGPLRDDKTRPFVGLNNEGQIQSFGTSTLKEFQKK